MNNTEDIIGDLLIDYERQRKLGVDVPLTQLCIAHPELRDEVTSRIQSLEATDWIFDETLGEPVTAIPLSIDPVHRLSALQETSIDSEHVLQRLSETKLVDDDSLSSIRDRCSEEQLGNGGALLLRMVSEKVLTNYQALALCYPDMGPLILGSYVIRDELGEGGMGKVYRAYHQRMKREVALKVLPPRLTGNPDALRRFEREVEVAAQLSHPNVVSAYDAGVDGDQHYLICEYVSGQTLRELVEENGPLPIAEALDCVRQAVEGLAYAHQQGVIHRDISPNNIMLSRDGTAKVLDLGLARSASDDGATRNPEQLTATDAVMGTASYMAPEQALNTHDADHRADIYSLGCTLFYLLTGRPPYAGETMMQKIVAHREAPIPEPSSIRSDIPEELSRVFRRMVAKRAEDRFQSMEEVLAALDEIPFPDRESDKPDTIKSVVVVGESGFDKAAEPYENSRTFSPAVDTEAPPATTNRGGKRTAGIAIALGALLAGGALMGVLLELRTEAGKIILTSDDPAALQGAIVTIDDQQRMSIDMDADGDPVVFTADAGKRRLQVSKGGFTTFTDEFELKRGDRKPIHVKLVPTEDNDNSRPTTGDSRIQPSDSKLANSASRDAARDSAKKASSVRWEPGPRTDLQGLLMHPTVLPGVSQWQMEAVSPRDGAWGADWHPNGKRVAVGGRLGQIRIYDTEGLQVNSIAVGHDAAVDSVRWSPDGKWLASGSVDTTVRLWNESGEQVHLFKGHTSTVHEVAWAPDSSQFASVCVDQTVRFWKPDGSRAGVTRLKTHLRTLAWHPEGTSVVAAGSTGEAFRLSASGELLGEIELANEYKEISALAYSPDGQWLCVGGTATDGKGLLLILDSNDEVIAEFPSEFGQIEHIDWQSARNGFLIEERWRAGICRLDAEGGFEAQHFEADGYAKVLTASPIDDRFLRVRGEDGAITMYGPGTASREFGRTVGTLGKIRFNPVDNSIVTAGSPQLLRHFDLGGRSQWTTETEHGWLDDLAWHPDGERFIKTGHGPIEIWNIAGDRVRPVSAPNYPRQAEWTRDGNAFVVHFHAGQVGYFSADGELRKLFGGEDSYQYQGFALHPDGKQLVLIPNEASTVELVDLAQPNATPRGFGVSDADPSRVRRAAWSPDGKWLAVERWKRWEPFEVWTAEGDFSERLGKIGGSNGFAWSPDSRRIVATSNRSDRDSDYWLAIYQIGAGKADFPQAWIETHRGSSTTLDWSRDGRWIASASRSGVIHIHDADSGGLKHGILTFADGQSVTFSDAGEILDGADDDLDEEVCYVIESYDGARHTLIASEFNAFVESGRGFADWWSGRN